MIKKIIFLIFFMFIYSPVFGLSFATSGGNSAIYYIAVTLTNSQSATTVANLPVKITINSNTNSSAYSATINNVNWQDGAGNILKSWLESGETNTSTSTIYWVDLASNTIASSGGTFKVYLVFYATSVNAIDGTTTGAEPNYTGTYGQYDNGASVFSYYYNYSGTSTPSGMAIASDGSTGSVTFNNYASVNAVNTDGTNGEFLYVNTTLNPANYIIEALVVSGSSDGHDKLIGWDVSVPTTQSGWWGWNNGATAGFNNNGEVVTISSGSTNQLAGSGSLGSVVLSTEWETSSLVVGLYNYTTITSSTSSIPTITNSYPVLGYTSSGGTIEYQWGRIRLSPPSFVLPSTAVGSKTAINNSGMFVFFER